MLLMTATFNASSEEITAEFLYNDLSVCFGNSNCNITIPSPDNKLFLQMTTRNGTYDYIYGVPVARLILRDNQALIEEGKAYDPSSPNHECSYSTLVLNDHQVSSSEFCCTTLE
uniref:Uncharacterized protein n=1 Tax=Panagrolaimus davidi TaxID=227884 RepID=A0A914QKM5_9BILA